MRPRKIQISGVAMATPLMLLVLNLSSLCFIPSQAIAQCTGANQTSVQSTTFTGGGNSTYNSTFTKFMPPAGYVVTSVVLRSSKTISPTWEITNTSGSTISVKPGVTEEDFLQLGGADITDALGNDVGDVSTLKNMTTATVIPDATTTTVTQPNFIMNKSMFNVTIATDNSLLNSFIGTGLIGLTYTDITGFNLAGAVVGVSVSPTFIVRTDFSITYNYCFTGTLASDILSFTATKKDDNTVDLNWLVTNENSGRNYIVEVSPGNSTEFSAVATKPALATSLDAGYEYAYPLKASDKGRLYFRLKLIDMDGSIAYSPMRSVDLGAGSSTRLSIYPNPPSDYINLAIPGAAKDWQIDILSADGSLIQRNFYPHSSSARMNFTRKLASGGYFVRATDAGTGQHYTGSFLVR